MKFMNEIEEPELVQKQQILDQLELLRQAYQVMLRFKDRDPESLDSKEQKELIEAEKDREFIITQSLLPQRKTLEKMVILMAYYEASKPEANFIQFVLNDMSLNYKEM